MNLLGTMVPLNDACVLICKCIDFLAKNEQLCISYKNDKMQNKKVSD